MRELTHAGASIYVCGDPAFARSMMESAADALGRDAVADLIVQHRYLLEVLPGPTAQHRQIDASELARHNEPGDDIWTAIDGRVYDLTAFAKMHPGGQRLIHSFAGMDATRSYRIVEHHRDPSIDALLSVFEIGSMRRLRLEPPLETLFRHWLRTQYLLTEIANAHELDASVRGDLYAVANNPAHSRSRRTGCSSRSRRIDASFTRHWRSSAVASASSGGRRATGRRRTSSTDCSPARRRARRERGATSWSCAWRATVRVPTSTRC